MPDASSSSAKSAAAEIVEPHPVELQSFTWSEGRPKRESYYRCGYMIDGAKPRMVQKFERSKESAEVKARSAAADIHQQLRRLGAPCVVFWWVQRWTTQESLEFGDATVEPV